MAKVRPVAYVLLACVIVLALALSAQRVFDHPPASRTVGDKLFVRCGPRVDYTPPTDCPGQMIGAPP